MSIETINTTTIFDPGGVAPSSTPHCFYKHTNPRGLKPDIERPQRGRKSIENTMNTGWIDLGEVTFL